MITSIGISGYKALRHVILDLKPISVLVGPNDSGKTSILEAVAALCRSVDMPINKAFAGRWSGREIIHRPQEGEGMSIGCHFQTPSDADHPNNYNVWLKFPQTGHSIEVEYEEISFDSGADFTFHSPVGHTAVFSFFKKPSELLGGEALSFIHNLLSGVQFYRWDADALSIPSAVSPDRRLAMESNGFGLAGCLDDILGDSRDRFNQLEKKFLSIFPQFDRIKLVSEIAYAVTKQLDGVPRYREQFGKGIRFELRTGGEIPASQASAGVLIVLAYLAILYLSKPPRMLLIEEPENGIHPGRLSEVLRVLRQLIEEHPGTQVLMTTHSPYVLDEFKPEEVSICQRKGDEVVVKPMSASKKAREQLDVFSLGEIWSAEGEDALLNDIGEPGGSDP